MPFADLIETVNITSLADGDMVLLDRVPQEADSGWDSLRDTYLVRNDSAGTDAYAALANTFAGTNFSSLVRGAKVGALNAWIQSRRPRCRARGLFTVEITAQGLLSPRGYRISYDAGANSQTGEDISVPNHGVEENVATRESQVTCDIEYIVTSGLTPSNPAFYTAEVGAAKDPPSPWKPTVKSSIWSFLTDYTYHYPNGWILDSCQLENLPGIDTVWLIRERYQYQYTISP